MPDNLDPLRQMEGFPLGKDEDLLALSNPPYYTAYPNPHIEDFIKQYGKPYDEATDDYRREPFVTDVSEGKNDPIYNAHSYHTKVPYKAVVPFIEHYTKPGDIVFDGFCGTGMIGVAAQLVGRKAILSDLAPAATFLAQAHNFSTNPLLFQQEALRILNSVEKECSWLYETTDSNGRTGIINYVVWSDVFLCPYCQHEFIYWDVAVNIIKGELYSSFECPHCKASLKKDGLQRKKDQDGKAIQVPVFVNYDWGKKSFEGALSKFDLFKLDDIFSKSVPHWYPTDALPDGYNTKQPLKSHGIKQSYEFFTKRNLWVLSCFWNYATKIEDKTLQSLLKFVVTGSMLKLSKRILFAPARLGGGTVVTGALYLPSLTWEKNAIDFLRRRIKRVTEMLLLTSKLGSANCIVSTQSTTKLSNIPSNSADYIFTDPPFGGNLMYSELNFIWESWLKVFSNNRPEAIINDVQKKELVDYRQLMTNCFSEMYRILKPGRWITVEFHNSKASVWNAIQEALSRSGFIVAQVTVLDKQQGSFKQVTSAGGVKNDLIINAYKPRAGFTQHLISQAGHGLETDFAREHLRQLPIAANIERSKEMLYSKYLAYYVQHSYQVAYNGEQFYRALAQWGFEERDGYWFADEAQAHEYEQRKIKGFGKKDIVPQAVLFVSDERSARQWVWNFLDDPKTYDEIYTAFVKALQTSEDKIPELKLMLEESFVRTNGHWKRPDQLTQAELEQKRLERLLRQFHEYLEAAKAGQKLKEVRREAVLAGFTECYREGRFEDILAIGHKLDKRLLEESPDLFDFVDIAEAKAEG